MSLMGLTNVVEQFKYFRNLQQRGHFILTLNWTFLERNMLQEMPLLDSFVHQYNWISISLHLKAQQSADIIEKEDQIDQEDKISEIERMFCTRQNMLSSSMV